MTHGEASMVALLMAAAIAINKTTAYVFPIKQSLKTFLRRSNANRRLGSHRHHSRSLRQQKLWPLFSDPDDDTNFDPNRWIGSDDQSSLGDASWEESLARREDGSLWSSFTSSDDDSSEIVTDQGESIDDVDGGEEAWLDALASISANEVEFMSKEADRADKVRQMQEMGFSSESISSTLGVAIDEELESDETNELFEAFKEETAKSGFGLMVDDDVDLETVESHSQVEWDDETNEPVRTQHVYVDEVSCIGCTNCAMIAQSTFFMEGEHGRARVFQQWGDDEETIETAIQTCPVDCIHYISYDELKRLEVERRGQNINNKARLVNQGEYRSGAGSYQAKYGGGAQFTNQQVISGNMGSRCNNCPSRGCKNCPMFGVGLNPEFQQKEEKRKIRLAKAEMKKKMESQNKRAEL
mmetsp:Transcript_5479/g.8601  ORF Transcript_5479/g.8601 Transcript_5479/m.8601 type:complete len:412 (+) Transcript_5479:132-1367(+)